MENPIIVSSSKWNALDKSKAAFQDMLLHLPPHLLKARWYGGKAFELKDIKLDHLLVFSFEASVFYILIIETVYADRDSEYYLLPMAFSEKATERTMFEWQADEEKGYVVDALGESTFHKALFDSMMAQATTPTSTGEFAFDRGSMVPQNEHYVSSYVSAIDQSNSSIFYNSRYFMKIYRKLFLDTNPEVDMLKFLSESGKYSNVPAYAGSLVWQRKKTAPVTFALLMNKVSAEKDSWVSTGDELNDFLFSFLKGSFSIHEFVFEHVELLAKRTAEMHLALSVATKDKAFKAEKFDENYRNWLYEHLMHLLDGRMKLLKQHAASLDEEAAQMAAILFKKHGTIKKFFDRVKTNKIRSLRTRIHGDFHLGQVLFHDRDFIIIDFEGEPESSIADRKIKHSPLKDVAGMIRSFHYAVSAKLFFSPETKTADRVQLQKSADRWFYLIRETYTETYLKALGKDQKLFYNKSELNFLFLLHLLEKAIYEIGYELNGRPDWLKIPLRGIVQVIEELEKYSE